MEPKVEEKKDAIDPVKLKKQYDDQNAKMKEIAMALLPQEAKDALVAIKEQGVNPYLVQIGEDFYIYRSLRRNEWKGMIEEQASLIRSLSSVDGADQELVAINAEMKMEENIVCKAVMWPKIDQIMVKTLDAGQIETLSNQIKTSSGFNQQLTVVKL